MTMEESRRLCASTGNRPCNSLLPLQGNCGVRRCPKVRRIGSKGAVLVIIWSLLVSSTGISQLRHGHSVFYASIVGQLMWPITAAISALVLVGPTAGLLASTYFGRYKTLYTGLWLMWAGNIFMVLVFILQWLFPAANRYNESILWVILFMIAATGYFVGVTLFLATAIPFGLDQMPDASGDQIIAFIHWYSWSFVGIIATPLLENTIVICVDANHYYSLEFALLCSLLNTVLLSATLCSNFLLHGWLTVEPEGSNPLKPFCGILKFAVKHKTPVRRSAFTYWEEEKPSRIDLAKNKYGGPFSNEQVEDVKTCLRMVAVIASISVAVLTCSAYLMPVILHLPLNFSASNYTICYTSFHFVGLSVILLYFAVCEVFIHPLIEKLFQSTLRKLGISLTQPIIGCLLFLVSTTVWYVHTNPTTCISTSSSLTFPVNRVWIVVPEILLLYSSGFLFHTFILEFICAQAPYVLRGMLVGLMYSICLTSFALGSGIYTAWKRVYQENDPGGPSCGIWFYVVATITAILGCVLWCAVAKWYKRRERDEPDMCRIFAENYYSR